MKSKLNGRSGYSSNETWYKNGLAIQMLYPVPPHGWMTVCG